MDANWWNNALQSYDVGREHRADRENAQAFQTGGYGAVEQAAGNRGDMQTAMTTRRFQDDERNRGYQAMEQIAPWARNLVRSTRNRSPEQSRPLLEQNAQRFVDFLTAGGADEETARRQVQAGIAGLTDPNPEVRAQWADTLDQAFQQHQDPNWEIKTMPTEGGGYEQRAIGVGADGFIQQGPNAIPGAGAAGRYATPDEVSQAGYRPGSVVWLVPGQPPRVVQAPNAGRSPTDPGSYPDDGYDYHD